MAGGIVGGQGFVVNASMVRADASRQKGVASSADLNSEGASRAVDEYLAVLDDAAFGAVPEVPPKLGARLGQDDAAGRAGEKRGAQPSLDQAHRMADGGGAHAEFRSREAAAPGNGEDHRQVRQQVPVHS